MDDNENNAIPPTPKSGFLQTLLAWTRGGSDSHDELLWRHNLVLATRRLQQVHQHLAVGLDDAKELANWARTEAPGMRAMADALVAVSETMSAHRKVLEQALFAKPESGSDEHAALEQRVLELEGDLAGARTEPVVGADFDSDELQRTRIELDVLRDLLDLRTAGQDPELQAADAARHQREADVQTLQAGLYGKLEDSANRMVEIERLRNGMALLATLSEADSERLAELELEIADHQSRYDEDLDGFNERVQSFTAEVEARVEELTALRERLAAAYRDDLVQFRTKHQSEIEQLHRQLEEANEEVNELGASFAEAESEVRLVTARAERLQSSSDELESELAEANARLERLEAESAVQVDELEAELLARRDELAAAETARAELARKLDVVQEERGVVAEELRGAERQLVEREAELTAVHEELARMTREVDETSEALAATQLELSTRSSAHVADLATMRAAVEEQAREFEELNSELARATAEITRLETEGARERERAAAVLAEERNAHARAAAELEAELAALASEREADAASFEARLAELGSELDSTRSELADTEQALRVRTDELTASTSEVDMLQGKVQRLEDELASEVAGKTEEIESLASLLSMKESEVRNLSAEHRATLERMQREHADRTQETISTIGSRYKAWIDELEGELTRMQGAQPEPERGETDAA